MYQRKRVQLSPVGSASDTADWLDTEWKPYQDDEDVDGYEEETTRNCCLVIIDKIKTPFGIGNTVISKGYNIISEVILAITVYYPQNPTTFFRVAAGFFVFYVCLFWYIGRVRSASIPKEERCKRLLLRFPILNILECVYVIPSTGLLFVAFSTYPGYLLNMSKILEDSKDGFYMEPIQLLTLIGSGWTLVIAPYKATSGSLLPKEREATMHANPLAENWRSNLKKRACLKLRVLLVFLASIGVSMIIEIIHFFPLIISYFSYDAFESHRTFWLLAAGINVPKLLFLFFRIGDSMLFQTVSSPFSFIYLAAIVVISTPCALASILVSKHRKWSEMKWERGILALYLLFISAVSLSVLYWTRKVLVFIPTVSLCGCCLWLILVMLFFGGWLRKKMVKYQKALYGGIADLSMFHFFCVTKNSRMVDLLTMFGVKDTPHRGKGKAAGLTGMTHAAKLGHIGVIQTILQNSDAKACINALDGTGYSAFHWSIFTHQTRLLLFFLIEYKDVLNLEPFKMPSMLTGSKKKTDGSTVTPLEFCLRAGNRYMDIGEMLYIHGIDAFSQNKRGEARRKKYKSVLNNWEAAAELRNSIQM